MTDRSQNPNNACRITFSSIATVAALVTTMILVSLQVAQAQRFSVLHTFGGWNGGFNSVDGASPRAGLTMDSEGNLYGVTLSGGRIGGACGPEHIFGCGTVFRLNRVGSFWSFSILYVFRGGLDGGFPVGGVTFGPDGSLYGTTEWDAFQEPSINDKGTVYKLSPPAEPCTEPCFWTKTILHRFFGTGDDGVDPGGASVVFDHEGNLYGTTLHGGYRKGFCGLDGGCGIVFKLAPSNDSWTESILYQFTGGPDGYQPNTGVIFDLEGNLYGVADGGTYGYGTVFQLKETESGWMENTLYSFDLIDGAYPGGGLVFDPSGNLYGTTSSGGKYLGGTVFELTPSGSGWDFTTLYWFNGNYGPLASLSMDTSGSLFGTTEGDGLYDFGNVFKLTPGNGGWTYADLHDFTSYGDGFAPESSVAIDTQGNLYGTAALGGQSGCDCGVVWEIMF